MATTEELIHASQFGNRSAVDELYRRYALRVLMLVRTRMGPALRTKEQSSDLAQEALLKSLRGLNSFVLRGDGAFIGYLAKKVEEVIRDRVDYWKSGCRNASRETGDDQPCQQAAVYGPSPLDTLEQHEEIGRLILALDRLRDKNESYWELIVARRLENQPWDVVADRVGGSVDSVRKKCDRALHALTRIFDQLTPADSRKKSQLRPSGSVQPLPVSGPWRRSSA